MSNTPILTEEAASSNAGNVNTRPAWKKWARRLLLAVVILAALLVMAVGSGVVLAERRMHRQVDISVKGVPFVDTAAARERGHYLYASRGCVDCHGSNGAGRVFLDDGHGLRIAGPNISPGPGSVVTNYTAQDWERSIRHGVGPSGRPLMIMPSEDYNRLNNDDFAALVAWIRSMPAATGGGAVLELPIPVKAAYGFGLMQDAAAKINHALPDASPVPVGITLEHGAYVANMCLGCHGANLTGGKIPGGPPDWPAAADLRGSSTMSRYAEVGSFMQMFKTGKRPDGSEIKVMPFAALREMNDIDVRALHLYLQSLKPVSQP